MAYATTIGTEDTYGEFSFNGHRCTEFGLHYIPNASSRWFSSPAWKTSEATVTGRHGGYWYGERVEIREFSLDCYFEDATFEQLEAIERWLHRLNEGKLIFDERPYVYYIVRPSAPSKGQTWAEQYYDAIGMTGSGKCTITFKAYQPFGILDRNWYDPDDVIGLNDIKQRTGLLPDTMKPADPTASACDFLVYNPGTEFTYPVFKIAGSAPSGLTITNHTTNETCTLEDFNLAESTYLEIDGERGSVMIQPINKYAFEYHTDGYVSLAPCIPYEKNIPIAYTSGSNEVGIMGGFTLDESYVGKYVWLNEHWYRIIYIRENGTSLVLNANMSATGTESTQIVTMNELEISGDDLDLDSVTVEYKSYVR